MGKSDFVAVHITNENIQVQLLKPSMKGDLVTASAHSRYLISKGWKGSRKSVPASYLTGYLAGKKAIKAGSNQAILYTGTKRFTQRMAAALKGLIDAGLHIPVGDKVFPDDERLNGTHLQVKNDVQKIKSDIDNEVR